MEVKVQKYFDVVDFNSLYRVKGCHGLFTCKAPENKSGMMVVNSLSSPTDNKIVRAKLCTKLSSYIVVTELGFDNYTLRDVLNNIHENILEGVFVVGGEVDVVDLMNMSAPSYDSDMYKPSHFARIYNWYQELNEYLKLYENERNNTAKNNG